MDKGSEKEQKRFQFLIGNLITPLGLGQVAQGLEFQFLIGNLITAVLMMIDIKNISCFNSL